MTFILQHAGMLEDLSPAGPRRLARRHDAARGLSERRLKTFRPRHLHPSQRPGAHIAEILADTVAIFGADRCLFGSNFPIEKLWTSYRELVDAHRAATAHLRADQRDAVFEDNRRCASIGWKLEQ